MNIPADAADTQQPDGQTSITGVHNTNAAALREGRHLCLVRDIATTDECHAHRHALASNGTRNAAWHHMQGYRESKNDGTD